MTRNDWAAALARAYVKWSERITAALSVVADHYDRSPRWITNRGRGVQQRSDARHVVCWILRQQTSLSLAEIGSVIGHSTVRHAIKRVEGSAGLRETAARLLERARGEVRT